MSFINGILQRLRENKGKTTMIIIAIMVIIGSTIWSYSIDCKQANPQDPQYCIDVGHPFLAMVCAWPPVIMIVFALTHSIQGDKESEESSNQKRSAV